MTEIDPDATRVDVSATEYAFAFEAPAAERSSFVMTNDGAESHVMSLAKLADGTTLEQFLETDDDQDLTSEEYESDVAQPGSEAVVTADLSAGQWAMICYLPTSDGQPHYERGMAETFTVD